MRLRRKSFDSQGDADGLQTDVMRFMAIIGFCMIAVLAMVRSQEVPDRPDDMIEVTPASDLPAVVTPESLPVPDEIATAVPQPPALAPAPMADPLPEPSTEPSSDPSPEPLVLRFESHRAFLALIRASEIELFAQTEAGFLRLAPDFRVESANPPRALHALRSASVPAEISRLFERRGPTPGYLVALPPAMQQALDTALNELKDPGAGGALVIDRNGRIRHET